MEKSKSLYRSTSDVMIAGVCGGLANYFGIDSSIVRLIFVLLAVTGGSGLLIYLVLWVIIPNARVSDKSIKEGSEKTSFETNMNFGGKQKNILGLALLFGGLVLLWNKIMPIPFSFEWIWPGILIAAGIYLIFR